MDESIALFEFSRNNRRKCVETVAYAHIELGLKIWFPHRSRQHAALRSRLKARCVPAAPGVGPRSDEAVDEELAEWAELEGDLARRELKATRDAHAKFCGEAFGICEAARGNRMFNPTSICARYL